jgi:conjugative transfer signal peptidase TraF
MRGLFFRRPLPRWRIFVQLILWPTVAVFLAGEAGVRFNTTASVPIGFYYITSNPNAPFVEVCPPGPLGPLSLQRKYRQFAWLDRCADGGEGVLKTIIAHAGDLVETSLNGIRVNGSWIPNTAVAIRDSEGRPLAHWPFGRYRLKSATVWVASSYNSKSFDSRYFGPVSISDIKYHLQPLLAGRHGDGVKP